MIKISGWAAIILGVVLALGEIVRNFGDWQWWPFWLVDFIAALLLIVAGYRALQAYQSAQILLAGAWGFSCAMFYMGFFLHVENINSPAHGNISQMPLTIIIGGMLSVSALGLIISLHAHFKGNQSSLD